MPYAAIFEPVVKPRENIRIIPSLTREPEFYTVEYVEPIFGLLIDLGTVNADSDGSLQELTDLDMDDYELGQFRILLLDDFDLIVKQPRAAERGTTKTKSTRITPYTLILDPELKTTEFFVFGDSTRIYLQPSNKCRHYPVWARVFIFGWKFMLEKLRERPAKYTDIPVGVVTKARR